MQRRATLLALRLDVLPSGHLAAESQHPVTKPPVTEHKAPSITSEGVGGTLTTVHERCLDVALKPVNMLEDFILSILGSWVVFYPNLQPSRTPNVRYHPIRSKSPLVASLLNPKTLSDLNSQPNETLCVALLSKIIMSIPAARKLDAHTR